MSVYLKQGVCGDYSRQIAWAIDRLHDLCVAYGGDMIITSIREGNHRAGSLHYIGDAIDWKICCSSSRGMDGPTLADIKGVLSEGRFANQFDVVDEGSHIHVEYDPWFRDPKETP